MKTIVDSNCLVAAVCSWHEHHAATTRELAARRKAGDDICLAAPALVEAYAVLTRLPAPHRLSPGDAYTVLEANWGACELAGLTPQEHWKALAVCRDGGVGGGPTYDAVIAACARKCKAGLLLTWNTAHFERFGDDFEVRTPAQ